MPVLPRWRYMTPQAQRSSRRVGITAAVLIVGLVLKLPLQWIVIGLAIWWLWGALRRR